MYVLKVLKYKIRLKLFFKNAIRPLVFNKAHNLKSPSAKVCQGPSHQ